jgi:VanZ family protein
VANPLQKTRRALSVLLCVYWVTLFAATHLTHVPAVVEAHGSDKMWHFLGYAGLAILLAARTVSVRSLSTTAIVCILGVAALYGAVDEVSQIPVGRDAEIADWYADLAGAAVGVLVTGIVCAVTGRLSARPNA